LASVTVISAVDTLTVIAPRFVVNTTADKSSDAYAYTTLTGSIVLSEHGVCWDEFPAAEKDDLYSRCVVRRRMRVVRRRNLNSRPTR
jgi:hypothetical protein